MPDYTIKPGEKISKEGVLKFNFAPDYGDIVFYRDGRKVATAKQNGRHLTCLEPGHGLPWLLYYFAYSENA